MRWTRKKTYAHNEAAPLEAATGDLLTAIDRQLREILEAAEVRAGEITRAADERAAELAMKLLCEANRMTSEAEGLLLEADRMTSEAEGLAQKRDRRLRGVLERRTRMQDAIEAMGGLFVAQQMEIERLSAIRSKAEETPDVPPAPPSPTPRDDIFPKPPSPTSGDDIFPRPDDGSRQIRRRLLRRKGRTALPATEPSPGSPISGSAPRNRS